MLRPAANATILLSSDRNFVAFAHAALGSPTLSTFLRAVKFGYLHHISFELILCTLLQQRKVALISNGKALIPLPFISLSMILRMIRLSFPLQLQKQITSTSVFSVYRIN